MGPFSWHSQSLTATHSHSQSLTATHSHSQSLNAFFVRSCPQSNLSKSDEECRNCDQNFIASWSFHYIDMAGTDSCCTHRVENFCIELYIKRWRNTEMAVEIPSRHFVSYGCQKLRLACQRFVKKCWTVFEQQPTDRRFGHRQVVKYRVTDGCDLHIRRSVCSAS